VPAEFSLRRRREEAHTRQSRDQQEQQGQHLEDLLSLHVVRVHLLLLRTSSSRLRLPVHARAPVEKRLKKIIRVEEVFWPVPAAESAAAPSAALSSSVLVSGLIVYSLLRRVRQHRHSLRHTFERLLSSRSSIFIWVHLQTEFLIRSLDIILRSVFGDPEHGVVVFRGEYLLHLFSLLLRVLSFWLLLLRLPIR